MTNTPDASNTQCKVLPSEPAQILGVDDLHHREDGDHPARLHTPTEAAEVLSVPESWLRRKAGQRRVPSTKLGKHLRFSHADLARIAAGGERPVRQSRIRPGRS